MVGLMANCFGWLKNRNKPPRDVKLVIIGLDDAGKTTTVACLQGEPPDGITPTVGFSNATLAMGKWNVTLYDLGGGVNVRTVWKKYFAEIYGIIFTVDSGNKERVEESKDALFDIFQDPKVSGKPVVIFANKQDKDGALDVPSITEELKLKNLSDKHNFKFNVFPCSAIKGFGKQIDKSIKQGFTWLLNTINEDYLTINEKVEKESKIQKEEETRERKERLERIRKLRDEREQAAKEAGVADDEDDEDDGDVMGGPFRNINDQVKITEKREKKEKENRKKIKAHQEKKENIEEEEDVDEIQQTQKRKKKKVKKHNGGDDLYDNSPEKETTGLRLPKINGSRDSGLSDSFEETEKPKMKKRRKKIVRYEDGDDILEGTDGTASQHKNPTKKTNKKNGNDDDDYDNFDEEEEDYKKTSNKKGKRNKHTENNYDDFDTEERYTGSNVIVVNSSENIKEEHDEDNTRKAPRRKYVKSDNDVEDDDDNVERDTRSPQEKANDSRVDLFRARSSDALRTTSSDTKTTSKKGKKKKKKKQKNVEEQYENEEVTTGSNEDTKRKKKKNKNKNSELNDSRSATDSSSNDALFAAGGGRAAAWNGKLPPIRENGNPSKLEPIELRGRLPDIGNKPSLNGSAW